MKWRRRKQPAAGRHWITMAACRSAGPDLFSPVSKAGQSLEQVTRAKAVCAGCLVRRQCLAFALRTRQIHGVWGGLTEDERHLAVSSPATLADER
jgi:WhiB family transcriptional regulator, redox-sensing transcriptional regulator